MAAIIPYSANLGSQQDTVSSRPNEDAYRVNERSFNKLGKNVMDTGAVVADIQRKYDREQEKIYTEQGKSHARRSSEENINKVLVDKELKEDGSNWFQLYGKYNEESKKSFLGNIGDDQQKNRIGTEMDAVMSYSYDNALKFKLDFMRQSGEKQHLGVQNGKANEAYLNPFRAKEFEGEYSKFVDSSEFIGSKTSAKFEGSKKIGEAAINSFLDNKKYGDALKTLGTFSSSFNPEEQAKKRADIDARRSADLKTQFIKDDDEVKRTRELVKTQQSQTFSSFLKDYQDSLDPKAPNHVTDLSVTLRKIEEAHVEGNLSLDQATILTSAYSNDVVDPDPGAENELRSLLIRKDVGQFESKLGSAVGNKKISGERAASLVTEYLQVKSTIGTRMVLSPDDHLVREVEKGIDEQVKTLFGKDPYSQEIGFKLNGGKAKLSLVREQFQKNLKDPQFKGDPFEARASAIRRVFKQKNPAITSGIKGANAVEKMQNVVGQYKRGEMKADKYKQLMSDLAILSEDEKNNRARKDGQ